MKLLKTFLFITAFTAVFFAFLLYEFHRFSFSSWCHSFSLIRNIIPYLCSGGSSRIAMIVLFTVPATLIMFFSGLSLQLNKKRMIVIVSMVFICFSVVAHISNNRVRALNNAAQANTPIPDESGQISIEVATATHAKWLTEANYCKEDSDCVALSDFAYYGGQCFAVNKNKALSLTNHSDPKSLVSYCDPKNPLTCVEGKCRGGIGVMPGYIHPIYVADFSKDDILIGASHNVFVGRVLKQSGEKALGASPETQFQVEIISNIKGDLKGTVTINQFGGYKNGTLVTVEDEGRGTNSDPYLLQPGQTYLLATRYNEQEDWYTLNSFPAARKLLSKDANASIADLKSLAQNDERVQALTAAYPNEKLLDADIQHQNTRNSFQALQNKP